MEVIPIVKRTSIFPSLENFALITPLPKPTSMSLASKVQVEPNLLTLPITI